LQRQRAVTKNNGNIITFDDSFETDLSYPIDIPGFGMCRIDINHAVFKALEGEKKGPCEIL
jgi:hypothetical protein